MIGSPDRASVTSPRPSVGTTPASGGAGVDAAAADDAAQEAAEAEPLMVPQVRIGADGQIIINEARYAECARVRFEM